MLYDPKWEVEAPAKLEPWQEIIVKMINLLEERGWCQGMFENDRGQLCIAGAYRMLPVYDRYENGDEAWRQIELHLPHGLASWNDAEGRTKVQVIDMLQSLIKS